MPKSYPSDADAPLPVQSCFMLTLTDEEPDVISDEVHAARDLSRLRPPGPSLCHPQDLYASDRF